MEAAASRATARTDVLQHNTAQNQMALTEPYTFWLEAGVRTRACAQEDVRTSTAAERRSSSHGSSQAANHVLVRKLLHHYLESNACTSSRVVLMTQH